MHSYLGIYLLDSVKQTKNDLTLYLSKSVCRAGQNSLDMRNISNVPILDFFEWIAKFKFFGKKEQIYVISQKGLLRL
jgi:hypothetical protein